MRRVSERLARPIACAAFLAAALPLAATAAPVDDYLAAKAKATAAAVADAKAGDPAAARREEAALKDLGKRMGALVGPIRIKGLGTPVYTLETLLFADDAPSLTLDGIAVTDKDDTVRVVVAPEPVFTQWLADRAKDAKAPAAFAQGLKGVAGNYYFVNNAVIHSSGSFDGYVDLPVATAPGETAYATLGFYADETPGNDPPNAIAVVRVANGRAMVGLMDVQIAVPPMPACDAIYAPFQEKADTLIAAAEKVGRLDDPRWEQVAEILDDGGEAFRACFAKAAKGQPFVAEATRKAEAFLKRMAGN